MKLRAKLSASVTFSLSNLSRQAKTSAGIERAFNVVLPCAAELEGSSTDSACGVARCGGKHPEFHWVRGNSTFTQSSRVQWKASNQLREIHKFSICFSFTLHMRCLHCSSTNDVNPQGNDDMILCAAMWWIGSRVLCMHVMSLLNSQSDFIWHMRAMLSFNDRDGGGFVYEKFRSFISSAIDPLHFTDGILIYVFEKLTECGGNMAMISLASVEFL